jgi:TRAP-type C4-dicarboxylate transport system permease small subunit
MTRILDLLARWVNMALALVLLAMVVLACVNVALRYIWQTSLLWVDETLVFLMIAIAFVGAIAVSARDRHLRMELFLQVLPPPFVRVLRGLELATVVGVVGYVSWYSLAAVQRLHVRGTLSNMAQVPLWIVHAAVLVGLAGMVVIALARLAALLARKDH